MTEVEFEKVCSITTSFEEIAKQMKIANRLKAIELRMRGASFETQPETDSLEKAFREEMDILRSI